MAYCIFAELKLINEQPRVGAVILTNCHRFVRYQWNLCPVTTITIKPTAKPSSVAHHCIMGEKICSS